jgi:signal transduction histidine kinase
MVEIGFRDIQLPTGDDNELEPFRQFTHITDYRGNKYYVIVRMSLVEKEDMFISIFSLTIIAIFLLLFFMYFLTTYSARRIFKDFYDTLRKLEQFSLSGDGNLGLTQSKVDEFGKLNAAVQHLAEKARNEYRTLKEFTEETNHELQTPLAVVRAKLEALIQSSTLTEEELTLISTALHNLNRLEKINQSILLLNKLEQKTLFNTEKLDISAEIQSVISTFADFAAARNISIDTSLRGKMFVTANHHLTTILFSNILSNAIRHNIDGGRIWITLDGGQLTIANNGVPPVDQPGRFFDRFYKGSASSESTGLGLTIARKICELFLVDIAMEYRNEKYVTIVNFNNAYRE